MHLLPPLGLRGLLWGEFCLLPCKIDSLWSFSSYDGGIRGDSIIQGRVALAEYVLYLPTFRKMVIPSLLDSQYPCLTLMMEALRSVET